MKNIDFMAYVKSYIETKSADLPSNIHKASELRKLKIAMKHEMDEELLSALQEYIDCNDVPLSEYDKLYLFIKDSVMEFIFCDF